MKAIYSKFTHADRELIGSDSSFVGHRLIDISSGNVVSSSNSKIRLKTKIRVVGVDGSINIGANCTLYGGRRFLLESILRNVPKPTQMLTVNSILDINTSVAPASQSEYLNRKVCLVGLGRGGASLTFGEVYDPSGNDNNLVDMIPLRTVPVNSDLSEAERNVYFMRRRVIINDEAYYQYFLKLVSNTEIYTRLQESNYTPTVEDNDPAKDPNNPLSLNTIQIYTPIPIDIKSTDVKEFFQITEGSLKSARFNELALYQGIPTTVTDPVTGETYIDYIGVEGFSKLTFNNRAMDNEGSAYGFEYYFIS